MPIFIKSIWFSGPLGIIFSAVGSLPHLTPPPPFPLAIVDFCAFLPSEIAGLCPWSLKRKKCCTEKAIWPRRNWVNWDTRTGCSVATTFALCTSYPSKGTPWKPPQWASSVLAQLSPPKLLLTPRCTADFLSAGLSVLPFSDFAQGLITLLILPLHLFGRGVWQLELKAHAALLLDPPPSLLNDTWLFRRVEETKIHLKIIKRNRLLVFYVLFFRDLAVLHDLLDLISILMPFSSSCMFAICCALTCLLFLPLRAMPV